VTLSRRTLLGFVVCTGIAVAASPFLPIPVSSTGLAQNTTGGHDSKFLIVSDSADKAAAGPAFVPSTNALPNGWGSVPGGAHWIGPATDQTNATRPGTCCNGTTVYQTTFSMTGLDPNAALLVMEMLADDWVDVSLNGKSIYHPTAQMFTVPQTAVALSGFKDGDNTLTFTVTNAGGGPTGLNADIVGFALPAPTGPPGLDAGPSSVFLSTVKGAPFAQSDAVGIWIRNPGTGGPLPLQVLPSASPSCPSFGNAGFFALNLPSTTSQLTPAINLRGYATNPAGIPVDPGFYRANLHITSGALSTDVCMNMHVPDSTASFSISESALTFNAQAKSGTASRQNIALFSGSGRVDWTATVISQNDFLDVPVRSGSTSAAPGTVTAANTLSIGVKPMANPGVYSGLVILQPSDPTLPAQHLTVVYNVTADAPVPDLGTAALSFVVTPGATSLPQNLTVFPSTSASQLLTLTATGGFLNLPPASVSVGGTSAITIPISLLLAQLHQGINRATIMEKFADGRTRTLDAAVVLLPPGAVATSNFEPPDPAGLAIASASSEDAVRPRAATTGCTPSQIAVQSASVPGNFTQAAGSPLNFLARVFDDCANPVTNASVMLRFSNGDPDLRVTLKDAKTGTYAATWNPIQPGAVTITARESAGTFADTSIISGAVTAGNAPVIKPQGAVHNFYPQSGTPLAPGTMATIVGTNLATTSDSFNGFPLSTTMDGTQVTIAGINAPIYSVDPGQINVEIPVELAPNVAYPVVVMVNGAVSAADTILINAVAPGIAVNADGTVAATHMDGTPVTGDNPALPGETVFLSGSGFGVTSPAVATNSPAPAAEPFARPVIPVTVTVDGNPADAVDAYLAPGGVGLYQIVVTVPQAANPGILTVIVKQSNQAANSGTLAVGAPPAQ
jgi:uncharacterized protein (TIGR03437 family)